MKLSDFQPKIKKYLIFILPILMIILLILIFVGNNPEKKNLRNSPVQELDMQTFYSRGSRDEEKRSESSFAPGDPIQIQIQYKNAYEKVPLKLVVRSQEEKVVQSTDFEIEGTKTNFVTVGQIQDKGKYYVYIYYNDNQIASTTFSIK